jgi:hypothetical protein
LATWNEVVNQVMGEKPRLPILEVGVRFKDADVLSRDWTMFRNPLSQLAAFANHVEGWPVHDLEEFSTRLSRLPLSRTSDRAAVRNLCVRAGRMFDRWRDYDRKYLISQSVVLEAARQGKLPVYASRSPKRGARSFRVSVEELTSTIKIDEERRHLVADQNGQNYPRIIYAPHEMAVFHNAKIGAAEVRAACRHS